MSREASFEEVQEARNFLVEQYRAHEPSREAIELALDSILEEKRRVRLKDGFRPPRTGRRTDVAGDAPNLRWVGVWGCAERVWVVLCVHVHTLH